MSRGRRKGRRGLSEEERALWERVARSATPLRPTTRSEPEPAPKPHEEVSFDRAAPPPEPDPPPLRSLPAAPIVLRPHGRPRAPVAWVEHARHPAPVGRPEPGLDRRTAERLRRGEREPDARIDLHGLTAERAHARLDRFMGEASRAGHRCLLVITGKGGTKRHGDDAPFMAPERGVLRQAAPRWLRNGPHAGRIVGIFEAHLRHGGAGAFYVYLKKRR